MLTLFLQALVSLLYLVFGAAALRLAGRVRTAHHAAAWAFTGAVFVLANGVSALQNVFGTVAFVEGRGSAAWDLYLAWAPLLNHSRTGALIAFFLLLFPPGEPRSEPADRGFWLRMMPGVLLGLLGGALVGWDERRFAEVVHYTAVAVTDTLELLVVLTTLFALLVRDRVDRLLWTALSVYGFNLALNVIWMSVLPGLGVPGTWVPPLWMMHLYRVVLAGGMAALALRRLHLARRGVEVHALLESPRSRHASVF